MNVYLPKRRSLGRYPIVPLDTAKAKARELLYQWYIGIDIEKKEMRIAQETVNTFTLEETINRYFSSRSLKSEADYRQVSRRVFGNWFDRPVRSLTREGLRLMAKAGFNPLASLDFWKKMEEQEETQKIEFLSTHPLYKNRRKIIANDLEEPLGIYLSQRANKQCMF